MGLLEHKKLLIFCAVAAVARLLQPAYVPPESCTYAQKKLGCVPNRRARCVLTRQLDERGGRRRRRRENCARGAAGVDRQVGVGGVVERHQQSTGYLRTCWRARDGQDKSCEVSEAHKQA